VEAVPQNAAEQPQAKGFRAWLLNGENLLLVAALLAIMLLPLTESALRKCFNKGIPGASALTQHLTLIIAMLGGAIAARDNRLLSMSALQSVLKGRWKTAAAIFSGAVAAGLAFFLCVASFQFVGFEKEGGNMLVGKLPVWVIQAVIPFGFVLVVWRLLKNSSVDNGPFSRQAPSPPLA